MQKYGFDDAAPVLERASARETAARVALGAVAEGVPGPGPRRRHRAVPRGADRHGRRPDGTLPRPDDRAAVDASPVRCLDPASSDAMVAEIDAAGRTATRSAAIVEVVAHGLPPGLGSHVHWRPRLDAGWPRR
jgi:chorismate synthase